LPEAWQHDVALGSTVTARFYGAADPVASTINTSSVHLRQGSIDVPIGLTVTGREITVTPRSPLESTRDYTVVFDAGLKDVSGLSSTKPYSWSFLTPGPAFDVSDYVEPQTSGQGAVAIGDVNGDGLKDVVFAQSTPTDRTSPLYVFLQRPGGTLAPAVAYTIGSDPTCEVNSVAVGDLDGDGKAEVVVGAPPLGEVAFSACGLFVFKADGNGKLSLSSLLPTADAKRIKLADMNRDGRLDIVGTGMAARTYLSHVSVYLQDGAGQFGLPRQYAIPVRAIEVDTGDLNGDGLPDIAILPYDTRAFSVLFQRKDGSFDMPVSYATSDSPAAMPSDLVIADVNSDGRLDVTLPLGHTGYPDPTSYLQMFVQDAQGKLAPAPLIDTYTSTGPIRAGDLNGDGRTDLVLAHSGWSDVGVHYQQPDKGIRNVWHIRTFPSSYYENSMAVGDVNNDGIDDVVLGTSTDVAIMVLSSRK
jgi:hypothetical protein